MDYQRKVFGKVRERILEPRGKIQVVAGSRQVGKSTLIDQIVKSLSIPVFMYNADGIEETDTDWIRRSWVSVRMRMESRKYSECLLIIDEIQKIQRWSDIVKREWDSDTRNKINLKVVLLGSSRLMLRKGLTESLAGRFELIRMGHWSYEEMHEAFGISLKEWIYYGGYPGSMQYINDEQRWRRYIKDSLVAQAIEKDVVMTSNIYKPALMKQLFELGCSYSGEMLSMTKLLGQLQDAGNVTTLSSYIEILAQCNMLAGLQKYAQDEARKRQSIPKFIVYNNALLTAYRGKRYQKDSVDPQIWGRWVESAVGSYLLDVAEENDCRLYYWHERNHEVDFVLEYQREILAIEVKSGRRGMNSGLPVFCEKYHPKEAIVVGTDGIPVETFLSFDVMKLFD